MKRATALRLGLAAALTAAAAVLGAARPAAADPSGYLAPEGDEQTLKKAAAYFDKGVAYLDQGARGPALSAFRRAAKLCPGFFEARYNVAKLEGDAGGRDKAIAELEALGRDFPANVRAFSDLGQLLVETDAEAAGRAFATAVANGEKLLTDKAIKAAGENTLAQLAVDLAFAYHNRGAWRLATGDLKGAEADFTRSIRLKDDNFFSHYGLGLALLQQGHFEAARAALKRAKELKRSFADCSIALARTYLSSTPPQPAFALAELKEVEALTGRIAQLEELYGDAYRLQEDFPTAIKHYDNALDLGADPHAIALKRALVDRAQGDREAARRRLRDCLTHTNDPAIKVRARMQLGGLAELDEDFATAAEHFAAALALDPDAHPARLRLGVCLYRTGKPDEAAGALTAVIEHYGDAPPAALADDLALARKLLDKIRTAGDNETHND